ncbi:hypothetical protein TYRP_015978 [Tyrophagus putrescentiae]|nr:hypothetical protein TYRP_015978 [Tyrophagus putrescentiae]
MTIKFHRPVKLMRNVYMYSKFLVRLKAKKLLPDLTMSLKVGSEEVVFLLSTLITSGPYHQAPGDAIAGGQVVSLVVVKAISHQVLHLQLSEESVQSGSLLAG